MLTASAESPWKKRKRAEPPARSMLMSSRISNSIIGATRASLSLDVPDTSLRYVSSIFRFLTGSLLSRLVSWNIEWMDSLFAESRDTTPVSFLVSNMDAGIQDVDKLCKKIRGVILESQADVIAVQEGPSDIRKFQLFVTKYLDGQYEVFGGLDGQKQRVYVLAKKGGKFTNPRVFEEVS